MRPDDNRTAGLLSPPLRTSILVGLHLTGWVLYGIAYYLTLRPYQPFGDILWKQTLIATGSGLLFSTLLGGLYVALRLPRRRPVEQALIVIGTSIALGLAWYQVKAWGVEWVDPFVAPVTGPGAVRPGEGSLLSSAPAFPILLLVWSGAYLSIAQWYARQTQERRRLQADAEAQRAQLRMLRYQLNPHFFFNALNTIGALADENPQRVKTAVRELSGFLRYTLLDEEALDAPLRDEFRAAKHYLAVEKIRFEDDLLAEMRLADDAGRLVVPSFLVLPLVENAVKHGTHTSPMPLRVRVTGERTEEALVIDVANTGHWREANTDAEGTGTGLDNVRTRLQTRYPDQYTFALAKEGGWVQTRIEIDLAAFDRHDG
jgi:two-component system LytT family sensor kinase